VLLVYYIFFGNSFRQVSLKKKPKYVFLKIEYFTHTQAYLVNKNKGDCFNKTNKIISKKSHK